MNTAGARLGRSLLGAVALVFLLSASSPAGAQVLYGSLVGRVSDTSQAVVPGADVIASANPGCMLQIEAGLRRYDLSGRVAHVVELLDEAYRK